MSKLSNLVRKSFELELKSASSHLMSVMSNSDDAVGNNDRLLFEHKDGVFVCIL